jgi:hypothetical protein
VTLFPRVGKHYVDCQLNTCMGDLVRTYELAPSTYVPVWSIEDLPTATTDGVTIDDLTNEYDLDGSCNTCCPDFDLDNICDDEDTFVCGDGIEQSGEGCDAGSDNGIVCDPAYGSTCTYCDGSCSEVTLTGAYCGDGTTDSAEGESCDDGAN